VPAVGATDAAEFLAGAWVRMRRSGECGGRKVGFQPVRAASASIYTGRADDFNTGGA
jgi:hypothetical protein